MSGRERCTQKEFSKSEEIEFGERVKYTCRLKRYSSGNRKFWEPVEMNGDGLFLGYRCISNGVRDYDSDEGWTYTPSEWKTVALICPNKIENPVYVPVENVYL